MPAPTTSIYLNSTMPAAPSGNQNVVPQSDGGTPQASVTFYPQVATTDLLGVVQPDGTTITITDEGVISAVGGGAGGGEGGGSGLWSGLIYAPTLSSPLNLSNNMNQQASFSASATTAGISLVDSTGKGSDFVECIFDSYPTAPFTLTWLQAAASFGSYNICGLTVADTLTGNVMLFGFRWGASGPWSPWVVTYATPNSSPGVASSPSIALTGLVWFSYSDDGTNISFSYSVDGVYFAQTYSVSRAASFLGSTGFNYIGFGMEPYSGAQMSILSLSKT